MSTNDVIDFRQEGVLDAAPDDLAAYLDTKSILPDLRGLTVFLVGLGETAPPQESLSRPHRTNVVNIWSSIARNGGAACGSAIDQPRTTEAPDDIPQVAAAPIPAVPGFVPGQMGELLLPNDLRTGFLPDEPFSPDPAAFNDPTAVGAILESVVAWLKGAPTRRVTVTGTTADTGPLDGQRAISAPELVQAAERRQVRRAEGSVVHVEVFRTGWCRNPHHRKASTPTHPPTRHPTPSRRYTSDRIGPAPGFGCGSRCPV
ncbi:hypothetical protein AB0H12_43835 [Actinosynnema sp. NPDC023794]